MRAISRSLLQFPILAEGLVGLSFRRAHPLCRRCVCFCPKLLVRHLVFSLSTILGFVSMSPVVPRFCRPSFHHQPRITSDTSGVWKYKAIYRLQDEQVSQWSDIVVISVGA